MARGVIVGGLLLVAAAAAAFVLLRPGAPDRFVAGEDEGPAATASDAEGGGLAARGPRAVAPKAADKPAFAGRVVGRVLGERDRPIAGVRVVLRKQAGPGGGEVVDVARRGVAADEQMRRRLAAFDAPGAEDAPPDAEATSDAEGRFSFAVEGGTNCRLDAKPEAPWLGSTAWAWLNERQAEQVVVLRVGKGSALSGTVVDEKDRPVAAVVSGSWWSRELQHHVPAVPTDPATGAFGFPAVPEGSGTLSVRVPGRLSLNVRVTTPRKEPLVIRVGAGGVLAGRVRDGSGATVADADVVVSVARADAKGDGVVTGGQGRTKSAADGAYRIEGLPAGTLSEVALAAPGVRARTESAPQAKWSGTEVREGAETTLDLVLSRGGSVAGRVLEVKTGAPVVDASVLLLPAQDRWNVESLRCAVDAAGRYRFDDVPFGRYVVVATAPRHVLAGLVAPTTMAFDPSAGPAADAPLAVVAKEGDVVERDVEMAPGLGVRGTVRGPDGTPVAGATVHPTQGGALSQVVWRWGARWNGESDPVATSGEDGTWRAQNLPPGEAAAFFARKAPLAGSASKPVRVAPDAPEPTVELVLAAGATVSGRVLDADGAPVSGRTVQWNATGSDGVFGYGSSTSDEEGRFRLEGLPAGQVQLYSWGTGSASAQLSIDPPLQAGEVREGIELRLARTAKVTGTVVDEAGTPVARTLLVQGERMSTQEMSGPDGTFEFALPEGSYQVGVAKGNDEWGFEGAAVTVKAPASGVRIVAPAVPKTLVAGRVVGPDGSLVPLCVVRVGDGGMRRGWGGGASDEVVGGEFRREVTRKPPFDVVVSAPRGVRGEPLNLRGGKARVEGPTTDLVITLESGAELRGKVLDPAGAGVAGVFVGVGAVSVSTGTDGAFRLGGLDAGEQTVVVRPPPKYAPVRPQPATPGGPELVVRLTLGGVVAGRVEGLDDAAGVQGFLSVENGERHAELAADRTFRLEGLTEGATVDLVLNLWNAEGGQAFRPVRAKGVAVGTTDLVLRAERGVTISGVVVEADGRPPSAPVSVMARSDGPSAGGVMSAADGTFTVEGLAPGPHTIEVRRPGSGATAASVKADAPATGVRVVLPPTRVLSGRVLGAGGRRFSVSVRGPAGGGGRGSRLASGTVGDDGTFRLDVPGDGPFALYVQGGGDESRYAIVEEVRPNVEVTVTLQEGASIGGTVDAADGGALPTPVYVGAESDRWQVSVTAEADGRFVLKGLPPGRYRLRAFAQNVPRGEPTEADAGATGVRLRLPAPK